MKQQIGKKFKNVKPARAISMSAPRSPLMNAMVREDNKTFTENGAPTLKSTSSALVDLFGMGGALRNRSEGEIVQLFIKGFAEDPLMAMKLLFHIRNARGGMGERRTFRVLAKHLFNNHQDVILRNLENIPFFGRFDDLYTVFGSTLEAERAVMNFLAEQIDQDVENYEANKPISLLAKWLPSENTSSKQTRALGRKIRQYFGWTPEQYRKTLSALREYLNVVEKQMSANEWADINYETVPSKASLTYRKAFKKHDQARYEAFIAAVKSGEKKINASTLFPYEIVEKILYKGADDQTMDALWDALPDYMEDKSRNMLVMADVSGSMNGRPMATSIALAMYTAERNQGLFGSAFITFTAQPKLQKIVGNNIREKIRCIQGPVGYNTNLQAAFDMILKTAVDNQINQEDMPAQILVISDMEFDSAQNGPKTNFETIREKYKAAGYEMPQLVYWNVNSRQNNVAAGANEKGVILVSGSSPSVFKTLLSGTQFTPTDQMIETLSDAMYDRVVI